MRIRPLVLTGAAAAAAVLAAAGSASAATVSSGSPYPQGAASDVTASPASLTFAPIPVSSTNLSAPMLVTITDTSSVPVYIQESDIADLNFDFTIDGDSTCSNVTLVPGASCTLSIQYLPLSAGTITNDAEVLVGDGATAVTIPLTGTGEAAS